jgi:hypothetical protein
MNDVLSLCNNQVMAFFRDLDDNNYEGLISRMTPDGVWKRQGKVMQGHDDVRQTMGKRPVSGRVHHLITNLVADKFDADRCEMRGYMLVIKHDGGGKPVEGTAPLKGIENIRTNYITLVRKDGKWLIAHLDNDAGISFSATA